MNWFSRGAAAAALLLVAAVPTVTRSDEAHDKMNGTMAPAMKKIDCSKAGAAMHAAMSEPMTKTAKMTGDVDRDFAAVVVEHGKMMSDLVKIELACGSNANEKSAAAAMARQEAKTMEAFEIFRSP